MTRRLRALLCVAAPASLLASLLAGCATKPSAEPPEDGPPKLSTVLQQVTVVYG